MKQFIIILLISSILFGQNNCPDINETISLAKKHAITDFKLFKNDNYFLPKSRKANYIQLYCNLNFVEYKSTYLLEVKNQLDLKKKEDENSILFLGFIIVSFGSILYLASTSLGSLYGGGI